MYSSDIIDRTGHTDTINFLTTTYNNLSLDIVTNPPYKYAQEFVEHALDTISNGHKVAMYLKLTFLEGKKRQQLFNKKKSKKQYMLCLEEWGTLKMESSLTKKNKQRPEL